MLIFTQFETIILTKDFVEAGSVIEMTLVIF